MRDADPRVRDHQFQHVSVALHRHRPDLRSAALQAHEAVCDRYGVPSIDLAREVASQMTAGTLTWKQYGGVHPAPYGNGICAKMIDELFRRAWEKPAAAEVKQPADKFTDMSRAELIGYIKGKGLPVVPSTVSPLRSA